MIDGYSANGAPLNIRTFKAIDQTHDIVCSARSLPIVELFCSHKEANQADFTRRFEYFYDRTPSSATPNAG